MFYDQVKESVDYIRSKVNAKADFAVILGSGLGKIVDIMENKEIVPYKEIPNFPQSSVAGHAGNLVFGSIGSTRIMALQGRFHYYEGFSMKEVAYPVYVMKLLGIDKMIVTNACGGTNSTGKRLRKCTIMEESNKGSAWNAVNTRKYCMYGFSAMASTVLSSVRLSIAPETSGTQTADCFR